MDSSAFLNLLRSIASIITVNMKLGTINIDCMVNLFQALCDSDYLSV